MSTYTRGVEAERLCATFLERKGYRILGERVRTAGGEIDLLALDGDTLVIVEVKARRFADAGLYAVTSAKQRRLVRAAEALMAEHSKIAGLESGLPPNMRFDVMAVCPAQPPVHVEDAWRPCVDS